MPSHLLESELFRDRMSTAEMRAVFTDEALVRAWVEIEVAVAEAQAHLGVIPEAAAAALRACGHSVTLDMAAMKAGIDRTWHPFVPFLEAFGQACGHEGARYLHWGLTTQDVMDTANALQWRAGLVLLEADLRGVLAALCALATEHAGTVMAGRTHGQQALPITFGYKVAVWASEVHRHLLRLEQLRPRVLTGNLTGAVGTFAAMGEDGPEVQRRALYRLGLEVPQISWHSSRDRVAELTSWLGFLGGTFGKIADELIELSRTELAEVEEPLVAQMVGSSTMPHKRNPWLSHGVSTGAALLRRQAGMGFEAMVHQHERDMRTWQAEWEFVPEMFLLASGVLRHSRTTLGGLRVRPEAMRANLDHTRGLIMSEAVMMHLAEKLGRHAAHDVVDRAVSRALAGDMSLRDALAADEAVRGVLPDPELDDLLDPLSYVGRSHELVEEIVTSLAPLIHVDPSRNGG